MAERKGLFILAEESWLMIAQEKNKPHTHTHIRKTGVFFLQRSTLDPFLLEFTSSPQFHLEVLLALSV